MKKLAINLTFVIMAFSLLGCGFFEDEPEPSSNWEASIIKKDNADNRQWHFKAFGQTDVTDMTVNLCKSSGDSAQWYGMRFNYVDSKNYYEFLISNEGKYRIAQIQSGSEVAATLKEGTGRTLKAKENETNTIKIKLNTTTAGDVTTTDSITFYANIEDEDSINEARIDTIAYTEDSLGHIYFAAWAADEKLKQTPLNVSFSVLPLTEGQYSDYDASEAGYSEGWQNGKTGTADEGYRVYFASETKKYNSCDIEILKDDFDGRTNDEIKMFTFEIAKDTGAFNYGYGLVFAHSFNDETERNQHYLLSFDLEGNWKLLKLYNGQYEESGASSSADFSCIENTTKTVASSFATGYGSVNKITIRRMSIDTATDSIYPWWVWINPTTEITGENAESMEGQASLYINDNSDTRLELGLIGFAPGVGDTDIEDLPYYPVRYRFKNVVPTVSE